MADGVIGIIPARAGSKGIPDKNIKPLAGHPLLAYSIAAAVMAGIDQVIVSTDSKKYAEIAKSYNAEIPFIRPSDISKDSSTDYEFMVHAIDWYKNNNSLVPEYWLHLRPTTPLRDPNIIKSAISLIKDRPDANSLRSGHKAPESPFKWFLKDKDGYFKGLQDDLTPEKVNLPRQTFPTMYNPDGYIDIVRYSHLLKSNNLHGKRMIVFESPQCTEVDIPKDFEYLEYEIKQHSSPLLSWLNKQVS